MMPVKSDPPHTSWISVAPPIPPPGWRSAGASWPPPFLTNQYQLFMDNLATDHFVDLVISPCIRKEGTYLVRRCHMPKDSHIRKGCSAAVWCVCSSTYNRTRRKDGLIFHQEVVKLRLSGATQERTRLPAVLPRRACSAQSAA